MNPAWNAIGQVLGLCGLAGTIVEFIYVWTNTDKFTNFEGVFFLMTGTFEMLGEVIYVARCLIFTLTNWTFPVKSVAETLAKDPIHIAVLLNDRVRAGIYGKNQQELEAWKYEEAAVECSLSSIVISTLPMLPWALFFPVWGPRFDGDECPRLALSIFSLGLIVLQVLAARTSSDWTRLIPLMSLCAVYTAGKVVEMYVILSHADRLIKSDLGWWLVGLQVTEVLSIVFYYGRIAYNEWGGTRSIRAGRSLGESYASVRGQQKA